MNVNEQLLHDAIRHAVQLEGYKNHAVVEVLQALNQAQAKLLEELAKGGTKAITKAHLEAMIATLKKMNDAAWAEVNKNLLHELVSLSEYEAVWQAESLKRRTKGVLPKDLSVNTPAPAQVWAAVKARPFAGGTLLEGVVEKLGKKSTERIEGAIRQGFVEGETLSQIEMKIRGTRSRGYKDGLLEMDRRHARTITRTAVAHTATVARLKTYEDNADLVKGIRFVATLDGRTSPICQALDGTVWEDTEKALLPPRHFGCRSTTVPVLKSWRELGFDLDEAPESTRASMNGQVPANLTYNDWLKKQPATFQDEVLGKSRGELFRSGGLHLKNFVSDNGRVLSLRELEAVEGISVRGSSVIKPDSRYPILGDRMEVWKGYERRETFPGGGFVDVHEKHGRNEMAENMRVAKVLAQKGGRVRLLEIIHKDGVHSADALWDEVVWEFKVPKESSIRSFKRQLYKANKQANRVVILYPRGTRLHEFIREMRGRLNSDAENIQEICLIVDTTIVRLSRKEIMSDEVYKKIKGRF